MSNFQFNENPYAAIDEDDEFNGPWYRNRTRSLAVALAGAAVGVLIVMMWHHNVGGKLASASSAEGNTATTAAPAAGSTPANSSAGANADGSKGSTSYLNGADGKSGSASASATAAAGQSGADGKNGNNGVDGVSVTTIVVNTIPGSPVTTVPSTNVPVTIPATPSTPGAPTTIPLINISVPQLLDIYGNLGNGQSVVNVDSTLPAGAKQLSNVNVAGVRTQTYDVSSITGHSSTVTLTFLNDLLTAKVKVGF